MVKNGQRARLFKCRAVFKSDIDGFELAAWRVNYNYRRWNFRFDDFVGDLPRFGDVVENHPKTEFFVQFDSRQNVVVPMRVKMDDAPSV